MQKNIPPTDCDPYYRCLVVNAPFGITKAVGTGWLFRRRSQFYPIFNQHYASLKEAGAVERIRAQYYDFVNGRQKEQQCPNYEGKPMSLKNVFSLIAIVLLGVGLSMVVLM